MDPRRTAADTDLPFAFKDVQPNGDSPTSCREGSRLRDVSKSSVQPVSPLPFDLSTRPVNPICITARSWVRMPSEGTTMTAGLAKPSPRMQKSPLRISF